VPQSSSSISTSTSSSSSITPNDASWSSKSSGSSNESLDPSDRFSRNGSAEDADCGSSSYVDVDSGPLRCRLLLSDLCARPNGDDVRLHPFEREERAPWSVRLSACDALDSAGGAVRLV
jgi:hypothetical protein